ncbi:glycerol-3-phosphate acyltransferase 3 isoform X1 [Scaptodrosophila lebanonensis]|uniref:Glycerol-3-phosphate acyltransferase 3 isoform X1 n=1 Tax=Drosophila lebanonensis TaxID=7225 RepID=A0A6J2SX32_DROLE|nr:glycerol-3-phosphate acyltransferase 3 isoform X1 [Scaptodrosophila lebanonensis]
MISTVVNVCWIPLAGFISFLIFLSAINKSVGVRKAYVNLLLRIFEYGRVSIETASQEQRQLEDRSTKTADAPKLDDTSTNGATVITRDAILLPQPQDAPVENVSSTKKDKEDINFDFEKCLDYLKSGVEAIIEDDVTSRFEAEELKSWNMLTRTNRHYEFISWKITLIWMVGFVVRYFILMPLRVLVCFLGVLFAVITNSFVALIPYRFLRHPLADLSFKITFRLISSSLSALIKFHNKQYKPSTSGFCVANHTSPLDVAILSTDCTFSLIGQRHGGFLGVLQRALARASPHIWFERGEAKDRHTVAERLRQHVSDPNNPPILIFPEGTCINNTSVMQFKKGSFEVGGVIYPVAIKYDPRFGDAFWNSAKYSMMQYLYMMMTSWAIVCDVWYLPPMYRQDGESAIDFANRVKSVIAKQGGLIDLVWDGQLKRMKPKKEWKEIQQVEFANRLKSD